MNCNSLSGPCVYITKDLIVLVYVDDCILISKEDSFMATFVQSLRDGPENFVFTENGTLDTYLGVCITRLPDNAGFEMSQPLSR